MRYPAILGFLLFFSVLSSGIAAQTLKANVSKVNITPPLEMKIGLGGYGARMSKPATGIHDSIWVKTLVLKKGDKKLALVTMDVLGLPPNVKPAVIEKLKGDIWKAENIMMLPSHTHASMDMTALNNKNLLNSPQLGIYHPELLTFAVEKIVESIEKADQNLQQVKIGTAMEQLDNMNRNRRKDPDVDRDFTVTRIDKMNGEPLAVVVNWTAHPTFLDENDMEISAGWPGYLQFELENKIGNGVIAMYYNGAQGDQSAVRPVGENHYEQAKSYGQHLSEKAHDIYTEIKCKKNVELSFSGAPVNLPERKAHPSFMETGGEEYGMNEEVVQVVMEMMCPDKAYVGVVKIGDMVIVGAPGELAAGLGLKIKKELRENGVEYPVIGGLANEWISYILSPEQYNGDGGYEASVSFYGESLGPVIVEAMKQVAFEVIQ